MQVSYYVLSTCSRVDKGNLQQPFTYNGKLPRAAVRPLLPVRQISLIAAGEVQGPADRCGSDPGKWKTPKMRMSS